MAKFSTSLKAPPWVALLWCALFATIAVPGMASADTITWNFNSPTGTLSKHQVYTATSVPGGNTIAITAYGYSSDDTAAKLYGKNDGTGEMGLGLAGESANEINPPSFIQLDLGNLINNGGFASLSVTMGSLSPPDDSFILYASSTLGSSGGVELASGGYLADGKQDVQTVSFPLLSNFSDSTPYLTAYSSNGSVLLESVSASSSPVPEPATVALFAIGGAALLLRRRRKVASPNWNTAGPAMPSGRQPESELGGVRHAGDEGR